MCEGFSECRFIEKLSRLDDTAPSIQSLSEWVIRHKNHYTTVVKIWVREILKAPEHRRITLMYLANDVIQRSRKIARDYVREFGRDLEKVCKHMHDSNEKTKNEIERLLSIWLERQIYNDLQISLFRRALIMGFRDPYAAKLKKRTKRTIQYKPGEPATVEIDGISGTHCPHTPPNKIEKLIEVLEDFDSCGFESIIRSLPVQNMTEKITNFTRDIPNLSAIPDIQDRDESKHLKNQTVNAIAEVSRFNRSYTSEKPQRVKLYNMMKALLQVQEEMMPRMEMEAEICQEVLLNLHTVHRELENHEQMLPGITPDTDHEEDFYYGIRSNKIRRSK